LLRDGTCNFSGNRLGQEELAAGWPLSSRGAQHLDSPEAYRRDRRKDMLLQQHGYFVLRFLAEDVGKQLDTVLDAILRALFAPPAPGVGWLRAR
jgi:hypothetical protein